MSRHPKPDGEKYLTRSVRFPPDLWSRLETAAQQTGEPYSVVIRRALERELQEQAASAAPRVERPIWERIDDLLADVPPEEIAALPVDGSEQHDHYITGSPKRQR